jgi:Ca2+-transporting ATPase
MVPGDLVVLASGDRIPADGKLLKASSFSVDESLLTGESLPIERDEGDEVFAGTLVSRGSGRLLVSTTGVSTRLGQIAADLDKPKPTTPLQQDLAKLSGRLGIIALGLAVFVFAVLGFTGKGWNEGFLTAVALAVAAVPEGLPTAVVLALALGVRRMARRGAIIRKLPAVETLGSATAILTDKTGTLTHNRIRTSSVIDATGVSHQSTSSHLVFGQKSPPWRLSATTPNSPLLLATQSISVSWRPSRT